MAKKKSSQVPHPNQPLVMDSKGTLRFKKNEIVCYLLDHGGIDLNKIATLPFDRNDREQFAQLIGYSVGGFSELSYVTDKTYNKAANQIVHIVENT